MSLADDYEWWRGAAIYQIYPRSFQDTTGDGIGDLKGVAQRLAHVASLGVDAVWLSPFFRSPMADMGYDVSDYRDVDPLFGTLADFEAVVAEAHRLGLKVMIDQVLSHTSDQHPWFIDSRADRTNARADWYVWADPKPDGTPPNNWLSIFGGSAWEWDGVRRQYYLHNFLASQPDLNFHNPEVRAALLDDVRFWLERGVDGFRLDTVNFYFHSKGLEDNPAMPRGAPTDIPDTNPYGYQDHIYDKSQPENVDFLRAFRALLDEFGARTSVGEVGDGARSLRTVAAYTGGGDKLHMSYTFDLLSPAFSAAHVRRCVEDFEAIVTDGWICWAFSNHDVMRHVSRWTRPGGDAEEVARFSIALLCALRGTICLYQGEELGLGEAELAFEDLRDPYGIRFWPAFKGRDGCRTPMVWEHNAPNGGFSPVRPWLPVSEAHARRAVNAQEGEAGSVLSHYRNALAFRRKQPVLRLGSVRFLDAPDDVLLMVREHGARTMLCAFNFAPVPVTVRLSDAGGPFRLTGPGLFEARIEGGELSLPPLGYAFAVAPERY
ncbi:MAG: alpha-glucosidase family protein [Rhizobiaceae bacterium]